MGGRDCVMQRGFVRVGSVREETGVDWFQGARC